MILPILRINASVILPDTDQWQFRFNVESASSNRIYIISQHKKKRHWGCSCPGWKRYRNCKHLQALNLPGNETPHEVKVLAL